MVLQKRPDLKGSHLFPKDGGPEACESGPSFSRTQTEEMTSSGSLGRRFNVEEVSSRLGGQGTAKVLLEPWEKAVSGALSSRQALWAGGRPAGLSHPRAGCQDQRDAPQSPLAPAQLRHPSPAPGYTHPTRPGAVS